MRCNVTLYKHKKSKNLRVIYKKFENKIDIDLELCYNKFIILYMPYEEG